MVFASSFGKAIKSHMERYKVSRFIGSTLVAASLLVLLMVVVGTTASENDNQGGVIGHGYQVKYAKVDNSSGKSLAALLQLISTSSVYGPDIQLLSLTARYYCT